MYILNYVTLNKSFTILESKLYLFKNFAINFLHAQKILTLPETKCNNINEKVLS